MPRRKSTTTKSKKATAKKLIVHPTPRQGITAYARSSYRFAESYVSLLMGVVVIVVAVLFVVSLIRATHHIKDTSSVAIGPTITPTATQAANQIAPRANVYVVQSGDDLWHISEKVYGSGYNWVDIAKANNLTDPGTIFSGNKLVLPDVKPTPVAVSPSPTKQDVEQQPTIIQGNSYTVIAGDNLWDIAVRVYNNGYRWVDIAEANNLTNPGIIHSGNVLKLPR